MRFSRKENRPPTVLMAVPAKSVTHEVWILLKISMPRLLISGILNVAYWSTNSRICSYMAGKPRTMAIICCTNMLPNSVSSTPTTTATPTRADGGSHATLPAMSHQRHHQRFDGQRQEQRDDDVEHQIGDVAPRAPAEHEYDDGEGHIQQRAAEPFRWPAGISLGGEQSTKVDTILVVRVCPGFCGTGSRRVGAVYVSHAFAHGSPL